MRERTPAWLLGRVRDLAMALPETDEVTSHGMPCFGIVRAKKFAYFTEDHHGDGKIALLVKISGADEQAQLIEMDADRYYRPAYFDQLRSEEQPSELQSLMRISYAVFCLQKKTTKT